MGQTFKTCTTDGPYLLIQEDPRPWAPSKNGRAGDWVDIHLKCWEKRYTLRHLRWVELSAEMNLDICWYILIQMPELTQHWHFCWSLWVLRKAQRWRRPESLPWHPGSGWRWQSKFLRRQDRPWSTTTKRSPSAPSVKESSGRGPSCYCERCKETTWKPMSSATTQPSAPSAPSASGIEPFICSRSFRWRIWKPMSSVSVAPRVHLKRLPSGPGLCWGLRWWEPQGWSQMRSTMELHLVRTGSRLWRCFLRCRCQDCGKTSSHMAAWCAFAKLPESGRKQFCS